MRQVVTMLLVLAAVAGASAEARAEDANVLNSRVCRNVSLSERDQGACAREMKAAKTDDDRAKIRKEFEAKILEVRERRNGS